MRTTKKPKTRKAWLVTWEFTRHDYFQSLNRPRVVAILKPSLSTSSIEQILPILFVSESHLTFSGKIGAIFPKQSPSFIRRYKGTLICGGHPWLYARTVSGLYVEQHEDAQDHQTLHWVEDPLYDVKGSAQLVEAVPARPASEEARFFALWGDDD